MFFRQTLDEFNHKDGWAQMLAGDGMTGAQTFFIDTFFVEVSIPGFPLKSTLFVSKRNRHFLCRFQE